MRGAKAKPMFPRLGAKPSKDAQGAVLQEGQVMIMMIMIVMIVMFVVMIVMFVLMIVMFVMCVETIHTDAIPDS